MFTYVCFYKDKKIVVQATSSYEAQTEAAKQLKARKQYDITVVLADKPINTASI